MLGQVFSKSPLSLCMYSIVRMPNPSQRAPIAYGEAYRKCKLITWVMTEHIRYHYINLIKVSHLKMMDWKGKTRWSKTWLNTHTHTHILTLKGKALLMQTKASSVPDNELRRNISIELYTYILLYFVIYTNFLLFWTRRKSEIWRTYRINLSLDSREQGCFTVSCRTCW